MAKSIFRSAATAAAVAGILLAPASSRAQEASLAAATASIRGCTSDAFEREVLESYVENLGSLIPSRCEDYQYAANLQQSSYIASFAKDIHLKGLNMSVQRDSCDAFRGLFSFMDAARVRIGRAPDAPRASCQPIHQVCRVATKADPLRLRTIPHANGRPSYNNQLTRSDSFAKGEEVIKKAHFRGWAYVEGKTTSDGTRRVGWSLQSFLQCQDVPIPE